MILKITAFIFVIFVKLFKGFFDFVPRHFVATIVVNVVGVSFHSHKTNFVFFHLEYKAFPEVDVFHVVFRSGAPIVLFQPSSQPCKNGSVAYALSLTTVTSHLSFS